MVCGMQWKWIYLLVIDGTHNSCHLHRLTRAASDRTRTLVYLWVLAVCFSCTTGPADRRVWTVFAFCSGCPAPAHCRPVRWRTGSWLAAAMWTRSATRTMRYTRAAAGPVFVDVSAAFDFVALYCGTFCGTTQQQVRRNAFLLLLLSRKLGDWPTNTHELSPCCRSSGLDESVLGDRLFE